MMTQHRAAPKRGGGENLGEMQGCQRVFEPDLSRGPALLFAHCYRADTNGLAQRLKDSVAAITAQIRRELTVEEDAF